MRSVVATVQELFKTGQFLNQLFKFFNGSRDRSDLL